MAPRDRENNRNRQSVPTENVAEKVHYIGVSKKRWGRYGVEIRNHLKKSRTRLGTYDTAEEPAKVYDAPARYLRGPFAITNFPAFHSAFEMSCQNPSSIQDNSAALDCRTTVGALSTHLPALHDKLTPLLGENVVSHISTDKSNNRLRLGIVTTCDCCYHSSGVLDAQVSHPPGMKNTGPNFIDLNLPPPEEDFCYPAAMETTTPRLLDLNILPSEY